MSLSEKMITGSDERLEQARAHRLADLRRRQELTQHQAATAMGVRQPRVSQLESSQLSRLEVATLRAYLQALGGNLLLVAEFGDEQLILET